MVAVSSCASLAKATGTSPATVVRFCRRIGFNGFSELKMSLSRSWLDQSSGVLELDKEDSPAMVKQKVLMFNKSVIDVLFETLDDALLERAVELLCAAPKVMMVGDGGSGCSASSAYDVLMQLGVNCEYVTDIFFQIIAIDRMQPGDVILAFSNSGRSKNTIDNLKQAKQKNITTIGIIGSPNAPISKYLDIELRTNTFSGDDFCDTIAARMCELSTISVLYSLILKYSEKKDIYVGRQLKNAYDAKRVDWKGK